MTGDGQRRHRDVVGRSRGLDKVSARDGQDIGRGVICGRRNRRRGDVADDHAVAGQVRRRSAGGNESGGTGNVVRRGTDRCRPVVVQNAFDIDGVGRIEHDSEMTGIGNLDVAGCECVSRPSLLGQRQLVDRHVIGGTTSGKKIGAGDDQRIGAGVVSGGCESRRDNWYFEIQIIQAYGYIRARNSKAGDVLKICICSKVVVLLCNE